MLTIGRTDSLELEFGVDQRDIGRVRPGQEVRLRVDALPQRTFSGPSALGRPARRRQRRRRRAIRSARVVANPDGAAQATHDGLRPRAHRSRIRGDPAVPRAARAGRGFSGGGCGHDAAPSIALALLRRRLRRRRRTRPRQSRRDGDRCASPPASVRSPPRRRPRWTCRSTLPSQLYVEHDAAVLARSSGVVEAIMADIGSDRGGGTGAGAAGEHRPGDRAGAGEGEARPTPSSRPSGSAPSRPPAWSTRADSEQVEFEHRDAELALRKAQRDFDLTRIVAPFAGVVTARIGAGPANGRSGRLALPRHRARAGARRRARAGDGGERASRSAPRRRCSAQAAASARRGSSAPRPCSTRPAARASWCSQLAARLARSRPGSGVTVQLGRRAAQVVAIPQAAVAKEGYALVLRTTARRFAP